MLLEYSCLCLWRASLCYLLAAARVQHVSPMLFLTLWCFISSISFCVIFLYLFKTAACLPCKMATLQHNQGKTCSRREYYFAANEWTQTHPQFDVWRVSLALVCHFSRFPTSLWNILTSTVLSSSWGAATQQGDSQLTLCRLLAFTVSSWVNKMSNLGSKLPLQKYTFTVCYEQHSLISHTCSTLSVQWLKL